MALDATRKVPLPEHGVVKKRMGDKTYIYYATAVYRNEKGQPTADRVSIGRYDDETGMLIPNRNYYEIYLKSLPRRCRECAAAEHTRRFAAYATIWALQNFKVLFP